MKRCNLVTLVTLVTITCVSAADNVVNVNVAPKADRSKPATLATKDLSGIHIPKVTLVDQTGAAVSAGGTGGDASAANQTAVQANAGSDASKAVAVQGITGGKSVPVSGPLTDTQLRATAVPVSNTQLPAALDGANLKVHEQGTAAMNVSQINGVTPLMGAGNTGTGSQRVTIASDQAAIPITRTGVAGVSSTALEASHVLKNSAGSLISLHALNTKTSAQYILIIDAASVPSDGAVTLLYPPINVPGSGNMSLHFPVPLSATNGIVVCNSSTGTFTKTVGSADCIFTGQVQ